MSQKNLAVFISGHGSNLNVFLENKEKFNKIITVSSNEKAYGLVRAEQHGSQSLILPTKIDWLELDEKLKAQEIDIIFLAGFMKIIPTLFIEKWVGKIFNLHPSLLPKHKGLHAIKKAYQAEDDIGATIHHVVSEVDAGEHVLQKVAIRKEDLSEYTLEAAIMKTHQCEHELVKEFISQIS